MPSSLLVRVIGLVALTAVLVLLFLPVPVFLKCLLIGLVLLAVFHAYRRHAMLTAPDAIVRLSLNPESGLEMERRDGQTRLVTVREDSFVAAWLTVLNLRSVEGRQCHTLLLLADNVHGTLEAVAQPFAVAFTIWGGALYLWSGALYLIQAGLTVRAARAVRDG